MIFSTQQSWTTIGVRMLVGVDCEKDSDDREKDGDDREKDSQG